MKQDEKDERGDGSFAKGGNSSDTSSSVFLVLFILSLIVIVGGIIFFMIRKTKNKGENDENEKGIEMNSTPKEDLKEIQLKSKDIHHSEEILCAKEEEKRG
jgi:flagellar basal body-associated protein FliL